MYKVIKEFTDLQDDNHRYAVGDTYPREGFEPTEKRIAQLAGSENRQRTPLIKDSGLDSVTPVRLNGVGQEAPFMNEPEEPVIEEPVVKKPRRGRKNKEN